MYDRRTHVQFTEMYDVAGTSATTWDRTRHSHALIPAGKRAFNPNSRLTLWGRL